MQIVREYDDASDTIEEFTEYTYNDDGIRVSKHTWSEINDTHQNDDVTVVYLVDSYNHTGYAQVLEERTDGAFTKSYIIGDDVIGEIDNTGAVKYLLYDGHGSTRQLAQYSAGAVSVADSFSYDGYGVLLQDDSVASADPGKVAQQSTNLLYTGEQFDIAAQMYYLRARYYNPLNGTFNRVDPFPGDRQDPQSLHKYLYCHANPLNNIDPSGLFDSADMMIATVVIGLMAAIYIPIAALWWHLRATEDAQDSELYERVVNPMGIWGGWVTGWGASFLFARHKLLEGRVYNPFNKKISAKITITGAALGLGGGLSGTGGALLIFNAYSLKDMTTIKFWDLEVSFDVFDPISEGALIRLLARVGVTADALVNLRRSVRLGQMEKGVETAKKIRSALDISDGEPTALLLTPDFGLQLYLGLSYNEVFVDDPSFE